MTSSTAGIAAPGLYPVQTGAESLRFRQGIPTLDLEQQNGAIQITPLAFDHGHVTFGMAIYNKGPVPANFGIENIRASIGDEAVPVLDVQELQKRAKSRAMWTQIGIAVLAGAAAGIAAGASTTNHYYGNVRTPRGTYSWHSAYRDNSVGVLGATAATAGGVAGVVGVQNRLDYTLANLSNDIVQTTTLDPEASYGGRIVLEKPKSAAKMPYDVHLVVTWNGAQYPFTFRVTTQGVSMPPAYQSRAGVPVPAPAPAPQAGTVTPAVLVMPAANPTPAMPAPVAINTAPRPAASPSNAYALGQAQAAALRNPADPYSE